MSTEQRQGVSAFIRMGDRILLIKRGKAPFKGYWSFPGGGVEAGETLEAAIHRELMEETTLRAGSITPIHAYSPVAEWHITVFEASDISGTAVAGDDAADVIWADAEALQTLPITPGVKTVLAKLGISIGMAQSGTRVFTQS